MCVERKPLQHMPIAVNTAMALPSIQPCDMKLGTRLKAAPTAPRAVIGKAIRLGLVKPNNHLNTKSIFSPIQGRSFTPSYAAPVYSPLAPVGPNVSIITSVEIISTPGMIAKPISTPDLPPSSNASRASENEVAYSEKEFMKFENAYLSLLDEVERKIYGLRKEGKRHPSAPLSTICLLD